MQNVIFSLSSFAAILVFASVHYISTKERLLKHLSKARFLSFGGGIAIAYVFIDLLPKLGKNDIYVQNALAGTIPYMAHHVFVAALLGFLLYFSLNRTPENWRLQLKFNVTMASYALFNFIIGYSVADPYDPEVQPLALFTLAIALHYFTNDYTLNETYGDKYRKTGKPLLLLSLLLGYSTGLFFDLSKTTVALLTAFIGGGVIINVIRHELPKDKPNRLSTFLLGTALYTALLLALNQ
jgi:hypothetical protein